MENQLKSTRRVLDTAFNETRYRTILGKTKRLETLKTYISSRYDIHNVTKAFLKTV